MQFTTKHLQVFFFKIHSFSPNCSLQFFKARFMNILSSNEHVARTLWSNEFWGFITLSLHNDMIYDLSGTRLFSIADPIFPGFNCFNLVENIHRLSEWFYFSIFHEILLSFFLYFGLYLKSVVSFHDNS